MHCKGHSRDESKVAEGNQLADCQARKPALYETPSMQTPLDRFCGTGKTTILRKNQKDMRKEEQRMLIKDDYSPKMDD